MLSMDSLNKMDPKWVWLAGLLVVCLTVILIVYLANRYPAYATPGTHYLSTFGAQSATPGGYKLNH